MMLLRKITLKTVFTLCLFALMVTSCSSDDDSSGSSSDSTSFFAKVNGTDFNPEFVTGFESEITNTILVTGSMGNGELIQIFLPTDGVTATYSFADDTNLAVQAYYQTMDGDALDVAAFATSGSVTINTFDTSSQRISGTFSFSGVVTNTSESFTVTEGSFNTDYEKI